MDKFKVQDLLEICKELGISVGSTKWKQQILVLMEAEEVTEVLCLKFPCQHVLFHQRPTPQRAFPEGVRASSVDVVRKQPRRLAVVENHGQGTLGGPPGITACTDWYRTPATSWKRVRREEPQ